MILHKIFDHDLHRAKRNSAESRPLFIETPAKATFIPAVVSSTTWDRYLVVRKLTGDGRMRSGVFKHDADRLDEILGPLFLAAYNLSILEKWNNIFATPKEAFGYVQKCSGVSSQPHACLIPETWNRTKLNKWAGKANLESIESKGSKLEPDDPQILIYSKVCRIRFCKIEIPVFLSRPDFVGLYTQIVGGMTSILLHNVRCGMAFVQVKHDT